jgi:hypothetical protein
MYSIYAFSRSLEPFKDKSEEEIARWLIEHRVNAIFGSYEDQKLVAALHRNGIKVYAEVTIFYGEKYWESHPESRPINAEGKPIEKIKWYAGVCPNQRWLWEEKLAHIERLVRETSSAIRAIGRCSIRFWSKRASARCACGNSPPILQQLFQRN